MLKEPFIVNIEDRDLPNLSSDGSEFAFEYSKTNFWQEDNLEKIKLINSINEKLDIIIRLLKENGKD